MIYPDEKEWENGPQAVHDLRVNKLIEGVIDGKTGAVAAQDAGFGVAACRTPWKLIPPDEMRARFQLIAQKKGLTLDRIGDKIKEHLEAKASYVDKNEGLVQSHVPDHKVQQKALDQLTTLLGMQDASKAAQGGSTISLSISGPAADRLAKMLGGE
jgi:hypothetical protein